jgi:hypothetical protein
MPPTFLYLIFFGIWATCACVVCCTCALLLFIPRTRALSGPLFWAMTGTFPFVIAYQILAAPVAAGVLLMGRALWRLLDPGTSSMTENPVVIVVSISTAFIAFATVLTLSVAGLYDGWMAGLAYGRGMNLRDAVSSAPAYNQIKGFLRSIGDRRNRR